MSDATEQLSDERVAWFAAPECHYCGQDGSRVRLTDEQVAEVLAVLAPPHVQALEWSPILEALATEVQERRRMDATT